MRPEKLYSLFTDIKTLKGIGDRIAVHYDRLCGGTRILDLIWHLPTGIIDRTYTPKIADAPAGVVVTLKVTVDKHAPSPPRNRKVPYRVRCSDDAGFITLVFFNAKADYLQRMLPEGEERVISGIIEDYNGGRQMPHPDYIVEPDKIDEFPKIEAVYPLTAGLTQKMVGRTLRAVLKHVPNLPEWLSSGHAEKEKWSKWKDAVLEAHNPTNGVDTLLTPAVKRLAYDELLAGQLALALVRQRMKKKVGRSIDGDERLRKKVLQALPFELTEAQARVVKEINDDMASKDRMLRLLQGDVGSGKTVVALMAALNAVEIGGQVAIMVPTDLLSRQHFATIEKYASPAGVNVALLTGRDKGKKRNEILEKLVSGEVDIIVGTHALFQDDVEYKDLALAIIDEQHRFGVHQRLGLTKKGRAADVLVMTATPIPRTLTMTIYGDMDVSKIDGMPPGRKPVDTRVLSAQKLDEVTAGIKRAIGKGARIYWVCPLVEESETLDLAAAEDRYYYLKSELGDKVGLVHGRMKGIEKDAVMEKFVKGDLDVLVATTVIEVGVDVPEASIMVIEHAERFGLAQLHQLRGRIGRGEAASTCILLYGNGLTETAKSRLKIMRETEDGFVIAEEDLRLRGAGEVLGTRQSGLPELKVADMYVHSDLLATARKDALFVMDNDPKLETERGKALKVLLYLFEKDAVVQTIEGG
ncbi:MAG: ATP-dependent DNA helicase RecG [Alphaproteobacteria bacterium]|nr:ATP-dependent DNA helicase RecG [Alphaproteobacteria bacterium]